MRSSAMTFLTFLRAVLTLWPILTVCWLGAGLSGCASARQAPQTELFTIDDGTGYLRRPWSVFLPDTDPADGAKVEPKLISTMDRKGKLVPDWGDLAQANSDVVTLNVMSLNIHDLPRTLTGSHDILLFVDVYENASAGESEKPISTLVYTAENLMVPGRANFSNPLAFGPTRFTGHGMKLRFTVLVLQRRQVEQGVSAVSTIKSFADGVASATPYGEAIQISLGLVKSILRAQQDVVAFDFEATFLPKSPEGLTDTIRQLTAASDVNAATKVAAATDANIEDMVATMASLSPDPDKISGLTFSKTMMSHSEPLTLTWVEPTRIATSKEWVHESRTRIVDDLISDISKKHPNLPPDLARLAFQIRTLSTTDDQVRKNFSAIDIDLRTLVTLRVAKATLKEAQKVTDAFGLASKRTATKDGVERCLDVILDDNIKPLRRLLYPDRTDGRFEDGGINDQAPWLRYGHYALVQTARWSDDPDGFRQVSPTVGDGRCMFFDGGWIYSNRSRNQPVDTNYLLFSFSPYQLPETAKTLAAAASEDAKKMATLKIDASKAGEAMTELTGIAERLKLDVAQIGADKVAEQAAQDVAKRNGGVVTQDKWEAAFGVKAPGSAATGLWKTFELQMLKNNHLTLAQLDDLNATTVAKWTARIAALNAK